MPDPEPLPCPECGGEIIAILRADTLEVPVYSFERGAAWIGPVPDFGGVEWQIDECGCQSCGWQASTPHDYEIGLP